MWVFSMQKGITLTIYQNGEPIQERDIDEVLIVHRFSKCGEITIRTSPDANALQAYKVGSIMTTAPISDAFVIEKVEITDTLLTATGRSADIILKRRVFEKTELFTGDVRVILQKLLTSFTGARALPINILVDTSIPSLALDFQKTGATPLDILYAICEQIDAGYTIKYNQSSNNFTLKIFKGKANNNAIFSPEYDNLANPSLLGSIEDYATTAYIAGEGEGTDRVVVSAGSSAISGINRFEIYVDQRSEKRGTNTSLAVYKAQLKSKGIEELTKHGYLEAMTGDVMQTEQCIYGEDYLLGDQIIVENTTWGISDTYTVVEVEESQTASGYNITPNFAKKGDVSSE